MASIMKSSRCIQSSVARSEMSIHKRSSRCPQNSIRNLKSVSSKLNGQNMSASVQGACFVRRERPAANVTYNNTTRSRNGRLGVTNMGNPNTTVRQFLNS